MTDSETPGVPQARVEDQLRALQLIQGHRASRAVGVAARPGLADVLAEGPKNCAELARATGTHPDHARLLLVEPVCRTRTDPPRG
ncbi:hypothetical protein [Streptomyces sp. P17]|uniref:methyltransferase family protein n=1 Tax=Streptomyces sp. P17 TaxID=3074716 RepID=UPI0028F42D9B|nr:hypothetical protein [Streptomyces sp. P17]MDT9696915.1 hypothetical protein [Streptomyces sp. P17]